MDELSFDLPQTLGNGLLGRGPLGGERDKDSCTLITEVIQISGYAVNTVHQIDSPNYSNKIIDLYDNRWFDEVIVKFPSITLWK